MEHPPLWLPARVRLADYPQLKQLAWQVHGAKPVPIVLFGSDYWKRLLNLEPYAADMGINGATI